LNILLSLVVVVVVLIQEVGLVELAVIALQ
jgi:hypothetical protein